MRPQPFDDIGDATDQAAAADRNDDDVELFRLLANLEAAGARSEGHIRAFKRMYEKTTLVFLDLLGDRKSLVNVIGEDDLGTITLAGLDPQLVCSAHHYDFCRRPPDAGGKRRRYCMVSRADGGNASGQLFIGQAV